MISSLLHLVDLRPRVYYTLTNFRGGGKAPLPPPSIRQCVMLDNGLAQQNGTLGYYGIRHCLNTPLNDQMQSYL